MLLTKADSSVRLFLPTIEIADGLVSNILQNIVFALEETHTG